MTTEYRVKRDGKWESVSADEYISHRRETTTVPLGDMVEKIAKPIAKVLRMNCLDKDGNLKPESGCGKRKAWLNKISPGRVT